MGVENSGMGIRGVTTSQGSVCRNVRYLSLSLSLSLSLTHIFPLACLLSRILFRSRIASPLREVDSTPTTLVVANNMHLLVLTSMFSDRDIIFVITSRPEIALSLSLSLPLGIAILTHTHGSRGLNISTISFQPLCLFICLFLGRFGHHISRAI